MLSHESTLRRAVDYAEGYGKYRGMQRGMGGVTEKTVGKPMLIPVVESLHETVSESAGIST